MLGDAISMLTIVAFVDLTVVVIFWDITLCSLLKGMSVGFQQTTLC
jgi:hypothetical protein